MLMVMPGLLAKGPVAAGSGLGWAMFVWKGLQVRRRELTGQWMGWGVVMMALDLGPGGEGGADGGAGGSRGH